METRGTGIALRGIARRFGSVTALAGVDLDLRPGEVHALLGENGAGKTTLLSVLSGSVRPDAGSILVDGNPVVIASPADALRLGIGTVHQHQTLVPTLTVAENLTLGDEGGFLLGRRGGRRRGRNEDRRNEDRRDGMTPWADLPMDATVGELAIGLRQRVEIAKALRRASRALLLDEPTAVLAPAEVEALLGQVRRLAEGGRAVVLVTHKLDEALAVCDRITVLRSGRVVLSELVGSDRKGARLRILSAMFGDEGGGRREEGGSWDDETGVLGSVPGSYERGQEASRVQSSPGTAVGYRTSPPRPLRRTPTARRAILEVTDVTVRDDRGAVALDRLSLELRAGEVLGVAGVAGNGQRELAEVVAGQRRVEAGAIRVDGADVTRLGVPGRQEAGVAFLTDERLAEGIVPGMPVSMNLALKRLTRPPFAAGVRLDRAAIRHRAVGLIAEHGIRPGDPARDIATLSGGNIQRALVARELVGLPRVLIASAPTAGLDLRTADRVLSLLRGHADGGAGVLLISNELEELLATADRILVLYRGRVAMLVERSEASGPPFDKAAIGHAMLTGHLDSEVPAR